MAGPPSSSNDDAHSAASTPKTSSDRPRSKSYSGLGHKKTPSGNILSRLPFFRTSLDAPSPPNLSTSPNSEDVIPFPDVPDADEDMALPRGAALAGMMDAQSKVRKRKGSLRKTALLGTGRLRLDRSFSSSDATKPRSPTKLFFGGSRSPRKTSRAEPEDKMENEHLATSTSIETQVAPPVLSLQIVHDDPSDNFLSPVISPTGPYGSTTDDDDRFTIPSTIGSMSAPRSKISPSPSPPSSEASLPVRRSSSSKVISTSPLSNSPLDPNEEYDYSTTEWWGWTILLVTWIVFVVGMGSCLEVWSWAWDVGETPYAPPELEDDPTLPIVGYYPALMVLTAVMSWVWVVVAWMGMKYFKHAKIQGD